MGRLGHTTPNVALRYQHAAAERDRAIAERLDVLMRAAQTAVPEPIAKVVSIERQRKHYCTLVARCPIADRCPAVRAANSHVRSGVGGGIFPHTTRETISDLAA
jgi:hypothetical protein